jgi:hypothetical protein
VKSHKSCCSAPGMRKRLTALGGMATACAKQQSAYQPYSPFRPFPSCPGLCVLRMLRQRQREYVCYCYLSVPAKSRMCFLRSQDPTSAYLLPPCPNHPRHAPSICCRCPIVTERRAAQDRRCPIDQGLGTLMTTTFPNGWATKVNEL